MTKRIKPERRFTSQPVKISKETIDSILQDIAEGSTRFHAAEANGIAYVTFYYWVKQGQVDLQYNKDSLHAYLVKALRKIERNEIKKCRKEIIKLKKGHKGCEWTLEKVYWQHFSGQAPAMELNERLERLEQGEFNDKDSEEVDTESGESKNQGCIA